MKQFWRIIERYYPWLLLLLGVDCFCFIILWISDIQAFQTLIELVVLTSILLFSAILFVLNKRETTRRELFRDFLSDPTICNEERLLSVVSLEEGESIRLLASVLQEHKNESSSMADALRDYEEYVEGWAHEAKTPLSLLTMLLDNRIDEISPSLQTKLDYVRSQLQENVTQMLYYARLKSSTKDYRFEDVNLNDCLGEVLEDYAPLLEEKQFVILNKLQSEAKGLRVFYYRELYMLGVFHRKPWHPSPAVREKIRQLDKRIEQYEFLMNRDTRTLAQLRDLRAQTEAEVRKLNAERNRLYKTNPESDQIPLFTQRLRELRKTIKLCKRIEEHSLEIAQRQEEEQKRRAEQERRNAYERNTMETSAPIRP